MARRTAEEAAQTRDEILRAARQLFTERGYAATSTRDVVQHTGVTRGALYHHFADKTDLFRSVFVDLTEELNNTVAMAALQHPDAVDALRGACEAFLNFVIRPDYRQIAFIDGPAVLGLDEWQSLDTEVGMASMQFALDALHHQGYLDQPAPHLLTVLLFGALTEAGMAMGRGDRVAADPSELIDAFLRLVAGQAHTPGEWRPVVRPPA